MTGLEIGLGMILVGFGLCIWGVYEHMRKGTKDDNASTRLAIGPGGFPDKVRDNRPNVVGDNQPVPEPSESPDAEWAPGGVARRGQSPEIQEAGKGEGHNLMEGDCLVAQQVIVFDSNARREVEDFLYRFEPRADNQICECAGSRECLPHISSRLVKSLLAKHQIRLVLRLDPFRKG